MQWVQKEQQWHHVPSDRPKIILPALAYHYTFPTISTVGQACLSWQLLLPPMNTLWRSSTTAPCDLSQRAVHLLAGNLTSTAPHSTQPWWPHKLMEAGTQKYEAPLLLHFTFLRKVRGHFLSLCQSISRTRWGGRVLLTEAAVRRKPTASTLAQHPYSCRHDTAGSLRVNLVFYSKGKTYSGNSNHFSLLL